MRIEIQWNSLFPLSMPYVTTLQYREIFWQNGSLLYGSDTAKQEFFMRLQLRLQSLHKHDFISNQLLFYCWLTQQHFNFSVSFSFKQLEAMFQFILSHAWHKFMGCVILGHSPVCFCIGNMVLVMKAFACTAYLTRWRLVPSILGLGSMGNACYSKIKSSSTGYNTR